MSLDNASEHVVGIGAGHPASANLGAGQEGERRHPEISVIVSTHNRREILGRCLRALEQQALPRERFEIIVVDDGSTDDTQGLVAQFAGRLPLICLYQRHSGMGAALRYGVEHAVGEFLLLINDDTICDPTLLEEHLRAQRQHEGKSLAVLGSFEYPPAARKRALTHYLATSDFMFPSATLKAGDISSYPFFMTRNLSIRREAVLQAGSFDTTYLVGEDTELGIRLYERGWRVSYHPAAHAWHDHLNFAIPNLIQRSRAYGRDYAYLFWEHPRCLREWRLPVPIERFDNSALAPLREFLDQHRDAVQRAVAALSRFDALDFEPLLLEECGAQHADTVLELFRAAVPNLHWYYVMEGMYETALWECDHPSAPFLALVNSEGNELPEPTARLAPLPRRDMAVRSEALSPTLHEKGIEAFRQGKLNVAERCFTIALRKHKSGVLWNNWATVQFRGGRVKAAEEGFRRALELVPDNAIAAKNLTQIPEAFARQAAQVSQDCEALKRQLINVCVRGPKATRTGRNLVMGMAAEYSRPQIEPFLCSLRRAGYAGDIVLFVSEPDDDLEALFRQYDVTGRSWKGVSPLLDVALGRYFCYYDYLARFDRDDVPYDYVLISDVRDVFFQRDPFALEPQDEVLAFLEDKSQTFGTSACNADWIRAVAGEAELARLGQERISCSGTTLGSWTGMLEYLTGMQLLALRYSLGIGLIQGVDQGMHNLLVLGNLLPGCRTVENGERVLTVGSIPPDALRIDCHNQVISSDGQRAAVVHQYDRHPELCQLVQRLYAH